MIDLRECTTLQLMPEVLRKDPEIQAAGYALTETAKMLMDRIDKTGVYAAIDILPEKIVDLMAVELRTQYYEEDLDIGTKRDLVKNTLKWYCRAGTPAAVNELAKVVFGSGSRVEEWFDYGGEPYWFKIIVDDQEHLLTDEQWAKIERMIQYVKNARSHLGSIQYLRQGKNRLHTGMGVSGYMVSVIGKGA